MRNILLILLMTLFIGCKTTEIQDAGSILLTNALNYAKTQIILKNPSMESIFEGIDFENITNAHEANVFIKNLIESEVIDEQDRLDLLNRIVYELNIYRDNNPTTASDGSEIDELTLLIDLL